MVFQDWFQKKSRYPLTLIEPANEFYAAVNQLSNETMWSVMERVNTLNACHFFMATHEQRPTQSYRIDFKAPGALNFIPLYRYRSGVIGQEAFRPGLQIRLDPTHLAFMQHLNGERSIREITERVAQSRLLSAGQAELEAIALELFEGLWRTDFLASDLSRR